MAIDRRHVGFALPPFAVLVTAERLRRFAEAIGDCDGEDLCASGEKRGCELGGPSAPQVAPLTFLKTIEGENNSSRAILDALGVDLKRVLHAEQQFDYVVPVHSGDRIFVERRVTDIYDKRNGALEFVVIESLFRNAAEQVVGRSRQLVMVRNPGAGAAQ